jgi:colanic acid/amylovoran biosynthesis glycosyltransferase
MGNEVKVAYITSGRDHIESFILDEIELYTEIGAKADIFTIFPHKLDNERARSYYHFAAISWTGIIQVLLFIVSRPIQFIKILYNFRGLSLKKEIIIAMSLCKAIKMGKYDFIQSHFGDSKFFVSMILRDILKVKVNLIVHAHELYANPNEEAFSHFLKFVDRIESISDLNTNILIEKFDVAEDRIFTKKLIANEVYNFSHKVEVLTVCRLTERKGIRELLDAAQKIKYEDFHFTIIGSGPIDVQQIIEEKKLHKNVTVYNRMAPEQLRFFYHHADVFCLPSKSTEEEGAEGIPVVIMEALSSELPVITTCNGSINEILPPPYLVEGDHNSIVEFLMSKVYEKVDWASVRKDYRKNHSRVNFLKNYDQINEMCSHD